MPPDVTHFDQWFSCQALDVKLVLSIRPNAQLGAFAMPYSYQIQHLRRKRQTSSLDKNFIMLPDIITDSAIISRSKSVDVTLTTYCFDVYTEETEFAFFFGWEHKNHRPVMRWMKKFELSLVQNKNLKASLAA